MIKNDYKILQHSRRLTCIIKTERIDEFAVSKESNSEIFPQTRNNDEQRAI